VVEVRMNVLNTNGDGLIPPMAESKGDSEIEPVLNQECGQIDRVTTGLGDEVIPVESLPLRRVSTRVPVSRSAKPLGAINLDSKSGVRRPVRDRWEYLPIPPIQEQQGSSGVGDTLMLVAPGHDTILGPVGGGDQPPVRLTPVLRRDLVRRFKAEGRRRRQAFRMELQREWESQVAPRFDQENDNPDGAALMDEETVFDAYIHRRLSRFDDDLAIQKEDFLETLSCAALPGTRFPDGMSDASVSDAFQTVLLQQRTDELWAGLRRVYFGEVEDPSDSEGKEPSAKKPRTRENVAAFKREIAGHEFASLGHVFRMI
jgi:hypothetical protein